MSETETGEETSESEGQEGTDKETADPEDNLVHAVLYDGASTGDIDNLEDGSSKAAQLAQGRGGGSVDAVEGGSSSDDREYVARIGEGRLYNEEGYFIRYVNKEHMGLTAQDVLTLPTLRSYPLPTSAYKSLPPSVQAALEEDGVVKVTGAYDRDQKVFYGAEKGWGSIEGGLSSEERLIQLLHKGNPAPAVVDYFLVVEGDNKWTAEVVADARGVQADSVRQNINRVKERLNQ
jgi:hypothetical protein